MAAPVQLREPPFWAVEFQPTITFPLGACASIRGVACSIATAFRSAGLYCAGGDAGGLQGPRYVAGLMLGAGIRPAGRGGSDDGYGGELRWILTS